MINWFSISIPHILSMFSRVTELSEKLLLNNSKLTCLFKIFIIISKTCRLIASIALNPFSTYFSYGFFMLFCLL